MEKTTKPGKQRKRAYGAPLHELQGFMHAALSRQLRKELGRRSLGLRKGDKVKITSGAHKKTEGKIIAVDRKKGRIFIDSLKRKKVSGKEISIPIRAGNAMLIELEKGDERRLHAKKKEKK
ncbi:MAG: 50S ribosomal protein L24 [Candidatus Diapherotrites archaeon]|nr:50S ribosomal protein L24 [Candidatus Diapherotrites archaeon]